MEDVPQKKRKFRHYIIGTLVVLFFISFFALKLWQGWNKDAVLELKGESLHVRVATTGNERYKGLSGREELGTYDGMIFLFHSEDQYGIVMRDMYFPIDILWLQSGEVIDIAPNVQPEPDVSEEALRVYRPRTPANAVLELKAGWVEAHDVQIGDRVDVML